MNPAWTGMKGEGRGIKWKLLTGVSSGCRNGVVGTFHPKIKWFLICVTYKEKKISLHDNNPLDSLYQDFHLFVGRKFMTTYFRSINILKNFQNTKCYLLFLRAVTSLPQSRSVMHSALHCLTMFSHTKWLFVSYFYIQHLEPYVIRSKNYVDFQIKMRQHVNASLIIAGICLILGLTSL